MTYLDRSEHEWSDLGPVHNVSIIRELECKVCGTKIKYSGTRIPSSLIDYVPNSGPYKGMRCHEVAIARVQSS